MWGLLVVISVHPASVAAEVVTVVSGTTALTPTRATSQSNTRVGDFWRTSTWETGQTITWHDGLTGGYAAYLGVDLEHRRAVVVLSDTANPATTDLGIGLIAGQG
jgi:hypothetical protein